IDVNATSFTFSPVNAPALGTIAITNGTFGNTTGNINVSVGALNYITINSNPGSGGTEVTTLTLTAGSSTPFYAVGYDSDGNYRSEVEVDWSSPSGNLDEVSGTGTSVVFNPVTAPSNGVIEADSAGFIDQTGLITVEIGNLDDIEIRTAAGGAGVIVGDTSMTTDQSLTMYAAGYDVNDNYLFDVSVSWSSNPDLDVVVGFGPSYTFNPTTANTNGTIEARSGIYLGETGTISVSIGALDHITINSSSGAGGVPVGDLTLTADDTYTFFAAGYDADNNFIAMVAAIWDQTPDLDDVFGTGTSYFFNPVTAPTSGTITATFSGRSDATGPITIDPGDLADMQINDGPGAGASEIGDVTLNVGVGLSLYAAGYDQYDNYIGPESSIWRSTGALDDVSFIGEAYTFTPSTADPAGGTIIANSESDGTVSDTTGQITVEEGVLTWIQIRTAPDGEGSEFGEASLTVDESITLYAAGYDAGDNFIDNIVVDWTSTPTLETISASDTSFEFSPTLAPAEGTIVATSGVLSDETGDITVSAGAPFVITDPDGLS
ncbi:MAG: hypothetical protein KAS58_04980, partial [Calditrichia bacterium]|nr:hypothetical protein [Calditrichia bacterium]